MQFAIVASEPKLFLSAFAASVLVFFGGTLPAQAFGENSAKGAAEVDLKDPLSAKGRFQPSTVEAGGTIELILEMQLAENYHAYVDRLKLTIEKPDDLKLAHFKVAPIVDFYDGASKSQKQGIERKAALRAVIEVPTGFKIGDRLAHVKLVYQACTADHCLFPKTIFVDVPFVVGGVTGGNASGGGPLGAATNAPAIVNAPTASSQATASARGSAVGFGAVDFESAVGKGLLSAFLLVFAVGFLTSLTPCIYPMIPITLAVLGARARNQSHWKNFSIALVYVLGIATTYSALGVLAASTGGLFGAALSNVWIVSGIALLFVAMGLSMFGLFEVQAPGFLRNRLGSARTTSGYGGAFGTGLVAGVVASPCIGPVLVSLLAYIAQTQNRALGFFMLFTFAFGMGVPFIVLGLSSSALSRMPKAGAWMDSVKFFFGIVMIGMAFYYIKPLYPTWLFQTLLGLSFVAVASHFGAFSPNEGLSSFARLRKGAMLTLLLVGVCFTALGVLVRSGFALPYPAVGGALVSGAESAGGAKAGRLPWKAYSQASLDEAIKNNRPVLIDFSAEWCGACHEMDDTTFIDKRVVDASNRFELLRVDGTEDSPKLREILTQFRVQGFPTYIFYDGKGQLRTDLTVLGYDGADDFVKRMETSAKASQAEAKN
jgi:thiol:disulfide interchange protein DsbD